MPGSVRARAFDEAEAKRMSLRILTLGGLRAFSDETELDWLAGQRLRMALLVYLAVERRSTREALTSIFWPESTEDNARQALRQTLYNLRRSIGEEWLERGALDLRASSELVCDALEFEAALSERDYAKAADLYKGPFLNAVHVLNLQPWETWVDSRRGQLALKFRRACRAWVNDCVQAGDVIGAINAARKWVSPDPFDNEAQHRLIELLFTAGEHTDAIRQYEEYARLLAGEGLEPLGPTRAIMEEARKSQRIPQGPPLLPTLKDADLPTPDDQHESTPDRPPVPRPPRYTIARVVKYAGAAAALAAGVWILSKASLRDRGNDTPVITAMDTISYLLVPLARDSAASPAFAESLVMQDELETIRGIKVIPGPQVQEAMDKDEDHTIDRTEALTLARSLNVDRFIMGDVFAAGESVRVSAVVYDARTGQSVRNNRTVGASADASSARSRIRELLRTLLYPATASVAANQANAPSVPAAEALARGLTSIDGWNLIQAEEAFDEAVRHDPDYAEALMWLALVRSWRTPTDPAHWTGDAIRANAVARRAGLPPRDSSRVVALVMQGDGNPQACGAWRRLALPDSNDFSTWYSYAQCLRADTTVVRDSGGRTGWRFRSSYHEAVQALRRAFQLHPSMHRSMRPDAYNQLRGLLYTDRARVRAGAALPPDTGSFVAYPSWEGDSLVFWPMRSMDIMRAATWVSSDSINTAVFRQRQLFMDIAKGWWTARRNDPAALEAVAVAIDLFSGPTAVDTLGRARSLSPDPSDRLRLAVYELWIRVKRSVPHDTSGLRRARQLADSILVEFQDQRSPANARLRASVAALLGLTEHAAALSRDAAPLYGVPQPLSTVAPSLIAHAAHGGPANVVLALEDSVNLALSSLPDSRSANEARRSFLLRAASVAFPAVTMDAVSDTAGDDFPLIAAQAAYLRGDLSGVRSSLDGLSSLRRSHHPSDIRIDALYPETELLARIGDDSAAIERLHPTLQALPNTETFVFFDVIRAGTLVRAMALRATLAARRGDRAGAARWARAVELLWADPDAHLTTTLSAMAAITR
jgi:DNA-binding SARP family transcriptional activator